MKTQYPGSQIKLEKLKKSPDNYKSGKHDEMYSSLLGNKKDNTNLIVKKDLIFCRTPWLIGKWLRGWEMNPPNHFIDPSVFLGMVQEHIYENLVEELAELKSIKYQLALKVNLQKKGPDGKVEFTDLVFRCKTEPILSATEIDLDKVVGYTLESLEKWTQQGSGWVINSVQTLWLDIAKYRPLKGSCCGFMVPRKLAVKKATVNIECGCIGECKGDCSRKAMKAGKFPVKKMLIDLPVIQMTHTIVLILME